MINLGALFGLWLLSTQEFLTFAVGSLGKRGEGHYGGPGTGHLERGDCRGVSDPGKKFCYFSFLL